MLQLNHISHAELATGSEHFTGPRPTIRISPGITDCIQIRKIGWSIVAVGGFYVTTQWVELVGLGLDREIAIPFKAAITRNWDHATGVATNWRNTYCLPANVAIAIGPNHIFTRNIAVIGGLTEFFPVTSLIHAQRS